MATLRSSSELPFRGALAGLRVVEAAEGIAGPFCARLLADLGAEVVKVESPAGDPVRQWGFSSTPPEAERGALFRYLNWNKRSVVLDLDLPEDLGVFRRLVGKADVLVETFRPGRLDTLGLGYEALRAENPGLVLTSITSFGQTGSYRDWQSDDIVQWAMGGYMYFGGNAEKAPLAIPGNQAEFFAAQAASFATLAALRHRDRTGRGQRIDQSMLEATLSAHAWLSVSWSHSGEVMRRSASDLMRCADGWVLFMRRRFDANVFLLIDRPDLIDDPQFKTLEAWMAPDAPVWKLVREWCETREAQKVYHAAQELRLAVTPVNSAADLLKSPQLWARDWWLELEEPVVGAVNYPGFPYRFSRTPACVRSPAPTPGRDADAVRGEMEGEWSRADRKPARHRSNGREEALAGIRVIELTANWAGPLAGRHLGDLGAEVIKVEHARRPATRALHPAGKDPAKYPFNRAGYFNNLNRNKYDVSLDVACPEGKELFLELVRKADVLIENNSARVMPNLGLGYDVLSQINPRLIMVSMSGFGATGPERDYIAYGANIEASCGMSAIMGYGDGQPYRAGSFYADPVTGNYGAIAVLAALREREASGRGQFIDMALNECAITFFGGPILEYQLTGERTPQRGNRHPEYAPQGCYRAMGNDDWVVLTTRSVDEWKALCSALGRRDWQEDPELAAADGRRRRHDEIDAGIAEWAAQHDHREAARLLQAAGVPAAPVLANWELLSDVHVHERGFYIPVVHPEVGVFPFPGFQWKLSETPGKVRMPAPLFGEHNDYVLHDLLGLSRERIAELEASGVAARTPVA